MSNGVINSHRLSEGKVKNGKREDKGNNLGIKIEIDEHNLIEQT